MTKVFPFFLMDPPNSDMISSLPGGDLTPNISLITVLKKLYRNTVKKALLPNVLKHNSALTFTTST